MASLFKVGGAELDLRSVLLLVEVFADFHDLIQVVLLAIDINCFFMLTRLNVEIGSFLPVAAIALKLGLLDQDLRVEVGLVTHLALAVFADQFLGFGELFQRGVDLNSFISLACLDVIHCCLFELTLEGHDLRLQPSLIEVVDILHLLGCLAKINVLKLSDVHEGFAREVELLVEQSLDTEFAPVRDSHAQARQLVRHVEVLVRQEPVEGRRLGDVDGIH
mmetsp:Transcript_42469/g.56020  ORF Transcript_42469/g.56020 Transcript_42469/m.56020 type:complete len:220 (-) Transcript_42469:1705-2364(-)